VYADPILIEQVLINLVRNAADALSGHRRAGQIRITAAPAGERFVRLDVEDDGPGLDGRSIEKLTAPFYSTKLEGMGMGLAICRSVIEIHHGSMDAGPSLLGGARLSFTLPLFEAHDVYTQDEEINA
jgi:two-component system sensor histidine kinase DctS